jgi:ribosome biogenesis GTPase
MEEISGIVVKSQSGFFAVDTETKQYTARLRGRFKQGRKEGDIIAVGDQVKISIQEDGTAMIEEIAERESKFSRMAPTARGIYEQIIIANPDQVLLTFACTEPEPNMRMLDRFLIIVEEQQIPSVIVVNKTDLLGTSKAKKLFGHYPKLGYKVIYTSASKKRGINKLRNLLKGKVSVLVGPSGVGKSSLLNAVQDNLGILVKEISKSNKKGKHTTVVREMHPLDGGGYVADTPGLKALALWDIEPEELDGYFPELRELVPRCKYSSCKHMQEPGCAVIEAVEHGEVHPERYESYLKLRMGDGD